MRILKKFLIMFLLIFITYYFMLPPLNLTSPEFWIYISIISFFLFLINIVFSKKNVTDIFNYTSSLKKINSFNILVVTVLSIFILICFINIINAPVFRAKSYANRINVQEGNFNKDIEPVNFNKLALLDKKSSIKLGDKVMGQMTSLVSQFEVSELYSQINYKDNILRVTPLEYASTIKYFTNRKDGIPGYITVNSVTGEAKLEKLPKGMKYMNSSMFFENLYRKLRFNNPFTILGEINFEIDDNGKPYWIVETIKYSGIGMKKEVSGVIILDPVNGNSKKYKINDIPKWVDHVYSSNLIIEELGNWGMYKNGFLNSIVGQKNVVKPTEGYNYLTINGDIYLYTGITSVSNDESNIGFVLVNLRNHETKFYNVPGTIEKSAMASAEGQIQQMNYKATFPLLVNLNNNPTYILSLKDSAGLVKMYAFVDYTDYQKVVVTDASQGIIASANNYLEKNNNQKEIEKIIKINKITDVVISGNTYYYIESDNEIYRASIKVSNKLPFLENGDSIKIKCIKTDIWEITKIVE